MAPLQDAQEFHECQFQAFDTNCAIKLPKQCCTAAQAHDAFEFIRVSCDRYNHLFSAYLDQSDIGRINNAHGEPCMVDRETIDLICMSLHYCEKYPEVFDISIGSASRLWDFHVGRYHKPEEKKTKLASSCISYKGITINEDERTVTLQNPHSSLDLGATAKGYIAERLVQALRECGIASAIIDLGGAITLLGEAPQGNLWTGVIADPRTNFDPEQKPLLRIRGKDLTIASSSVVLRSFIHQEHLYHHILNPKTGMPMDTDLLSVSIISASAFEADCLSTIALASGFEKARTLIEEERVLGVVLQNNGRLFISPELVD